MTMCACVYMFANPLTNGDVVRMERRRQPVVFALLNREDLITTNANDDFASVNYRR